MLQFQLKDTKDVSISKPILAYVQENYQLDQSELPLVQQACDELEQARFKYYTALRGGEQTAVVKTAFLAYIQRLRPLGVRFTFGGSSGGWSIFGGDKGTPNKRVITIEFQYTDQFDKQKWISSTNLNFEIANVCINYANRLTRDAHEIHDPANEQSINDTCQMYKEAAAIFKWLSEQQEIVSLGAISPDLSFDTLNFFSCVLFAQVQAMFPERAILKQSSAGIIAQLTAGTCKAYEEALTAGSATPLVKGYLTAKGRNWLDYIDFQRLVHGASANLWYAKIQFESGKYGDELAYLYCARSNADGSTKHLQLVNEINPQAVQLRNKLATNITTRLQVAEKDNAQIYFAKIPDSVPLVPAKTLASFGDVKPFFETVNDPFSMLVDSAVRDTIIATQKELEGMVNAISGGVQGLADQIHRELHAMNLPGALEVIEQGGGANQTPAVPDDLWNKINLIQTKGGLEQLERSLNRSKQASSFIDTKLKELRALLKTEEETDNRLRQQYGQQKWSRQKSADLIKPMLDTCDTVQKLCTEATKADQICEKDFNTLRPQLQPIISKDRNALAAQLPRNTNSNQNSAAQPYVTDLRQIVNEVTALIFERDQLIGKARALLAQLVTKLRSQLGSAPDREKFIASLRDELHTALLPLHGETQIPKQTQLLQRCNVANRTFVMKTQSSSDSSSQQLQDAFQKYYTAIASYNRVRTNLDEGAKFYQDLTQDTITPLEQRVKDYCMARDMEKSMWIEDLNHAMANLNVTPQQQPQQQYRQGPYTQPPTQQPQQYQQGSYSQSPPPPQQPPRPQTYYQQPPAQNYQQSPAPSPYGYNQQPYGAAPQPYSAAPSPYGTAPQPAQTQGYPQGGYGQPQSGYPGTQGGYGYNQGYGYR